MVETSIAAVRSFNRQVAATIGFLDDRFLGRHRPVGESRLLWEVGEDGADVRELRDRLDLDSGYVSRMLRSLESEGLVVVAPAPADRRRRHVSLTTAGRRERDVLDRRSDELAASILDALDSGDRDVLVEGMRTVERLLVRSRTTIARVDPEDADLRWCVERYADELARRFDGGFDLSHSDQANAEDIRDTDQTALLLRVGGERAGCGLVLVEPDGTALLKRIWLAPRFRGLGLGAWLLQRLEHTAAEQGARIVRLDTNGSLTEAIAMYRRYGYTEVAPFTSEPYAHHRFQKGLM